MQYHPEKKRTTISLTCAKTIVKHFNTSCPIDQANINRLLGPAWYSINLTMAMASNWFEEIHPSNLNWVGTHPYEQAIQLVTKKLWKEAKKVNKTKFALGMYSEGFTYLELKFYSDCFERMARLVNVDFKEHSFAQISGTHPHLLNQPYLHTHCKNFKLCPDIKFVLTNHLEQMQQGYLSIVISDEVRKEFDQLNNTPTIKPYKFLFYNNYPKLNRTYLVGQIMHRNLESKGLMSLNLGHDLSAEGREMIWDHVAIHMNVDHILNEYFPRTGKEIFNSITENKEKMMALKPLGNPRWELADGEYDSYAGLDADGRNDFRAAYFGITIETKYFHDRNITSTEGTVVPSTLDTLYVDCITFTEKTYKFISGKIPFILSGMPKSLHVLKDSGYKTFHPYINEDYDNIEDDELRLVAIADEIERLCGLSDEEWLEIQRELIPRLEHNYQLLLNQNTSSLHLVIND